MYVKRTSFLIAAVAIIFGGIASQAFAQSGEFYAGKNLNVLVGTQVGGTADTIARGFAPYLKKHLAGNPNVVVQNMAGAGSNVVFNHLAERAAPDGLTIVYSTYQALAQALGDRSLRARFENFEYLGGVSDTRVNYMRTDTVPGGAKKPSDIMRAGTVVVGAYNSSDFAGTLSRFSLDVLGVKHKLVVGYRGGADIFLAMQRNEIQFHNTSIGTFRTRSAGFIKSGEGIGVYYLASVNANGEFEKNKHIAEMPAFPELYREVHGKLPSGPTWDALNWLTAQTGELAYAAFAPRGTPANALLALRSAFERAASDPEYIKASTTANGIAHDLVGVAHGRSIVRSLANVSPEVLNALRTSTGSK